MAKQITITQPDGEAAPAGVLTDEQLLNLAVQQVEALLATLGAEHGRTLAMQVLFCPVHESTLAGLNHGLAQSGMGVIPPRAGIVIVPKG